MRDLINTVVLDGDVLNNIKINGEISIETSVDGEADFFYGTSVVPQYEGEYAITPENETIILQTAQKQLSQNITINPIPQNYGLITWNGAVLTVS